MLFPILLTAQRPSELLPHPDWEIIVWIVGTAVLLVVSTTIYIVSAIRNRGNPKPERLGHGNLGGRARAARPAPAPARSPSTAARRPTAPTALRRRRRNPTPAAAEPRFSLIFSKGKEVSA